MTQIHIKTHLPGLRTATQLAILMTGLGPIQGFAQLARRPEVLRPDKNFRRLADGIKPDNVAQLRLYGAEVGQFENDPMLESNPKSIQRVIVAMRHGLSRYLALANQGNIMEVRFKKLHHKTRKPVLINFSAVDFGSHGPEFQNAIRSIIQRHTAHRH